MAHSEEYSNGSQEEVGKKTDDGVLSDAAGVDGPCVCRTTAM